MKKLMTLAFVCVMMALCVVSCKDETKNVVPSTDGGTEMTLVKAAYLSQDDESTLYNFAMWLNQGCTVTQDSSTTKLSGTGYYYYIHFLSRTKSNAYPGIGTYKVSSNRNNPCVIMGYTYDPEEGQIPGGATSEIDGSYRIELKNDSVVAVDFIVGGNLYVESDKMIGVFTLSNVETLASEIEKIYYLGTMTFTDYSK